MTSPVGLGMPGAPSDIPVLAPRRKTRQLMVGNVGVGSDHPVSVQSMCTTKTHDINATLQQIAELTASGCDIVRVACPRQEDADALSAIAKKSQIPVIADIHFQPRYIFAAIDAGCAAVRVNPGNIKEFDGRVKEVAKAAGDAGIPIRIGVNAGSLDPRLMQKYGKATPEALVESALWEASLFEEHGFGDIKISVKHNDPVIMVEAYRQLAAQCDYPLHLGVTEAGPAFQGTIKSAVAFGSLLSEGIGDTIRVSLSAPPAEEIKVGTQILQSLNLRPRKLEIVSCPSCGRAQVDVYTLANEVTAGLEGMEVPLRVAVMGCVVNGPGEAREADLGVASGNGKGQIFVKGKVIKTVPEAQIVETLIEEAMRIAEEMEGGEAGGAPVVTVG
ncbi:flavodoxin-dependent (E)-4-hydroxy-3-methylbut-2-enyl-diphosphate synthase [Rhodococcus hoagii]|uniref:4-hydroxy-3-methylbut-2-en-1-yl diphosphate synthase (flavodoxin) n=1 Tax=Rhodococcus hoagii (strain 103S) TaxID=685727 RepID=A0A3S5Y5S5_RHOH1|nr:flavodoxin-dependent (E)-4-hydroxy-3-methylbut-2-enyl-diphosphate synthase [Prescottella equi]MBM4633648.1 flavodoxin-dependent (E)-4-hydroxy-3-methylbut-2-enyl-diphosphate synthase [Prescottella equi]MBM4729318.1 flavodoxin-dependent (E)-4-hydroxy-3-methylbut-2-enyl-diphosphate synthase [Prescottella equi]MDP8015523.1 flavodoxin-dependent (E)-4-hydroxy-3-methylbut-2-enyl-diphosphate synthase [Prescottella equi]NKR86091.1 flavodoxin-dependent (E)-4-hydroxy-3-methylbut-2-enyl-diphosphate synt